MADLLLTHGYFLSEDEKERQIMKPYPPLGLLYLSAFLKTRGYAVEIFDSTFARAQPPHRAVRERDGHSRHLYDAHDAPLGARDRRVRPSATAGA